MHAWPRGGSCGSIPQVCQNLLNGRPAALPDPLAPYALATGHWGPAAVLKENEPVIAACLARITYMGPAVTGLVGQFLADGGSRGGKHWDWSALMERPREFSPVSGKPDPSD
ncbi:MAG: hypothetical protein WBD34_22180 [Burkholderiaceae bacterium]